jgi:hypothetical protein
MERILSGVSGRLIPPPAALPVHSFGGAVAAATTMGSAPASTSLLLNEERLLRQRLLGRPRHRQVQPAVGHRPAQRAGVGQEHPDLAVVDLARSPRVLPLDRARAGRAACSASHQQVSRSTVDSKSEQYRSGGAARLRPGEQPRDPQVNLFEPVPPRRQVHAVAVSRHDATLKIDALRRLSFARPWWISLCG